MRRDFLQLALDVVQRQLRHLEQHQAAGAEAYDLPAQLRADGPARPGDQHALAADARAKEFRLRRDRIPSQQVAHIHVAQLVDLCLAGNEVPTDWAAIEHAPEGFQLREDLAPPATGDGRQCQQDPVYLALPDQLLQGIAFLSYAMLVTRLSYDRVSLLVGPLYTTTFVSNMPNLSRR